MQHDMVIDNDTGRAVRLDINNALAALVGNSSGTTEPTTTYPYQFWVDTTLNLFKIRNSANTAWIIWGDVTAANLGSLLLSGGTLTGNLLLQAAGTLSTPALAFDGDPDTGVHRVSANILSLVAGATEFLRCDNATYAKFLITSGLLLPSGTTAQRPTPASGILRFNSDLNIFEGYKNGNWGSVGGGGGGAGFQWKDLGGNAAQKIIEFNDDVFTFEQILAQELYGSLKVPSSYSGGTQIKLYICAYSLSTSGTILLQATTTLLNKNSTAADDATNTHTSTNSALTNTVAKEIREFVIDLTDSTGKVNSVAVAAGDTLKFKLIRNASDTDTGILRMIPNQTDVSYS